jgi:hypothetical protein
MYVKRSAEEIDASNKYQSYVRGWTDGASVKAMRKEFKEHPTLGSVYCDGYAAGYAARGQMTAAASKLFGHEPSILRVCDSNDGTKSEGQ